MSKNEDFTFVISLSVLNHLGRNLYRSFVTVLGEAISNSWDADARNVWIYIDREKNGFVIKDDGIGMTAEDFQEKFLKIGYSKRKGGKTKSAKGRPFIGRKGIGKLALLSCAKRISVISKTITTEYVGGTIDNSGLDQAITDDLKPQEYPLASVDRRHFARYTKNHSHGTIIYFEDIKGGIRNTLGILKKIIALYFRFSLLDKSFDIHIDKERISLEDLNELAERTEFLWTINDINDPFVTKKLNKVKESKQLKVKGGYRGFVASVKKPRDLSIIGMDERVTVDLFVNGRLREKNILRHIPTSRIVEDYLYGQIHFDELDEGSVDRFTSDREGVVAEDDKYQRFLSNLLNDVIRIITDDWDKWRIKNREDGDSENPRISRKDRKSGELYNAVSAEYSLPKGSKNKSKVDGWVEDLANDAQFNFGSYAECFVAENLVRKYVDEKKIPLSKQATEEIEKYKRIEKENKEVGNISIDIRDTTSDTCFLSMQDLAALVDKPSPFTRKEATLLRDAYEYKPIRDALAHTSRLTTGAKLKLTTVFENIRARVNQLLS
jgi:hypothetical protein